MDVQLISAFVLKRPIVYPLYYFLYQFNGALVNRSFSISDNVNVTRMTKNQYYFPFCFPFRLVSIVVLLNAFQ